MASRGSAIQRFLRYVRENDIDEVRVAFTLAKEIVERRLAAASQVPPNPARAKRTRTRKSASADAGVAAVREGESLSTGA